MVRLIDAAALHERAREDCARKGIIDNADFDFLCGYLDTSPTICVERNWISVDEQLPDHWGPVLVHYENGDVREGCRFPDGGFIHERLYGRVTHWMPMPFPPEV